MRPLISVFVPLSLAITGCSALGSDENDLTVAAGFYPLEYVAERIAGDHAEITTLTQPGDDAHDLELGVQQTALVSEADLVIRVGGFQPAVDDAVTTNGTGADLDAAGVVDLLAVGESEEEHGAHEHEADEDAAEEDHADDDHGHDHGDEDPHFWHDPLRMASLGDAVADQLAEIDPDNAASYMDNAEALRADLEALDQAFTDGLAQCERDTVVVSHDAFAYLEKYGIHTASINGLTPDAEPTPAHIAELQELIGEEGITTVFYERTASAKLSEAFADDLGIDTAVLDPSEALTDETDEEDYVSLMESNLEALRAANDCT